MNCFGLKEGTIIINQNHLAAKFTHNFPEFVFIYLEQLRILLYFGVVSEKKFFFSKTFIFASKMIHSYFQMLWNTLSILCNVLYLANQMMFMNGFFPNMNQCYYYKR